MAQLAENSANRIREAFDRFHTEFKGITRRSKARFEQCDWAGAQRDSKERLDIYKKVIDQIVTEIRELLGAQMQSKTVWMSIKRTYSELIAGRNDLELAETFFNSVTRKIFATVGVERDIEYIDSDFAYSPCPTGIPIYQSYPGDYSLPALMKKILLDFDFNIAYRNVEVDAQLIASRLQTLLADTQIDSIEVVRAIFYRNKGAYIIARIRSGDKVIPLALPLLNTGQGIYVDAVLLTADEVSIIFSFTRSYFHVEAERPHELIEFLKSIVPLKRVAELYISLGYNKHGKTELYRNLLEHLAHSQDKFETAPGKKGMVMIVFTLSSYDVVFKIIKDKPAYPKTTTRRDVLDKYNLVFMHDRAGRLIDAQEFEHLKFDKSRFTEELLGELTTLAANTVMVEGDSVIIKHLYAERKVTPLNIYIKEADRAAAREAVIDYGSGIKELVAANIFPGDILLKNFGVTRHGRVVFYDYDEICLVTECNFREIPPPRNPQEELEAEPWYYVAENDIFPAEFKSFLEMEGELRELFLSVHGDIFSVDFWSNTQERLKQGEISDIFPYRQSQRFNLTAALN